MDMSGMDHMSSTSSNMSMSMKMYFHGTIGGDMLWFASWMPSSAGATVGVCIGLFILAIFERYLIAFRRACDAAWRKGQVGYVRPSSNGPLTSSSAKSTSLSPPVLLNRRSSNKKEDVLFTPSAYAFESNHDGAVEPVAPYSPSVLAVRDSQEGSSAPSYTHSQQGQTQAQGQSEKGIACNPCAEERVAEIERYKEKAVETGVTHSHLPKAVRRSLDPGREGRWSRPFRLAVDIPRGLLQALQTFIHYLLMLVVMTFNIWWMISVVIGCGVGEMLFGRFGSSHVGH
ncbi:hypothetical protein I308_103984 [Cryptococcus tetragattii IND107]|uniref:Copper transport protein n=1 Tax=Cryptococcus tetragattii IND107 TaxID=1296105 RepID=A0ABR3BRV7_9TREE